uniref:Lipocalin-like domain-containing protein n=1 Tax=Meloidogyne hapla TaxID=6305 RepID=A0A1I8BIA7_MELHA
MDGEDTLTEKHIRLDKEGKAEPEDAGEVYRYTVDNDKLLLTLEKDSIIARRFFTRVE